MAAPFTLSDLTLNEYATLARLIGGDPAQAMTSPASVKYAEAHAGLLVMRARRDGDFASSLPDFMALSLTDVNRRLGLIPDDPDTPALASDDDDGRTVDEVAADAASEATGAAVDPTVPPASHGSAITQGTPRLVSATAPEQR